MLNIDGTIEETQKNMGLPLFRLGFRPFFLCAGIFAVISMMVWVASYTFSVEFDFAGLPPNLWHAHEMVFGYVMAVVAGFLLTAIKNWTGLEVLRGKLLASLLLFWLIPRVVLLSGIQVSIELIAIFDVLFVLSLAVACLLPVIKVKQYKQLGIISILLLLALCNAVFYSGVTGVLEKGIQWGLYSAIYIVITLILLMMRRVMPMFIKNGVDGEVTMKNRAWVDVTGLVFLLCLWVTDVFTDYVGIAAAFAAALAVLHLIRLSGWYTNKIWSKPLVWVLVGAYGFIILGFALTALSLMLIISPFIAIHAFTAGGIGIVTIGMMARVSLGHTGRNVFEPPSVVFWIVSTLFLGAVARVIFPLLSMELYTYWIVVSQVLWILAFSMFTFVYAPMLVSARVDGRDG